MSSAQATSAAIGTFAAKQGVQLVQEVPASVASAVGLAGFTAWYMLSGRGDKAKRFMGNMQGRLKYLYRPRVAGSSMAEAGDKQDEDEFVVVDRDVKHSSSESGASEEWDHISSAGEEGGPSKTAPSSQTKSDDEFEDSRGVDEDENMDEKVIAAILGRDSQTAIQLIEDGLVDMNLKDVCDGLVDMNLKDVYSNSLLMLAAQSGSAQLAT
eukprot:CAMPEP_0181295182 /NCGR_PEP_ID=MMETSP1101-20121128/4006_1 /TAXON_ID=46948 /ORGANISM="Rhodomonas abbreviata, Strain Caron Lab Isolate" /LENGTH=210 /DNA_ID=CAMNT_0023399907 /DNA_START=66 /DNA_END=694 /DNA_ORIENTATION=-